MNDLEKEVLDCLFLGQVAIDNLPDRFIYQTLKGEGAMTRKFISQKIRLCRDSFREKITK